MTETETTDASERKAASADIQDCVNQLYDELQRRIAHVKGENERLERDNAALRNQIAQMTERELDAIAWREDRVVKALRAAFEVHEGGEVLAEDVRNVLASVMDAAPKTVELGRMLRLAFGDGVKSGVKSAEDAHGQRPSVWLGLRAKAVGTEDNPHEHGGETFTWSPRDVARRFADIVPIEAVQQRLDALEAKLSGFQNDPPAVDGIEQRVKDFNRRLENVEGKLCGVGNIRGTIRTICKDEMEHAAPKGASRRPE